MPFEKRFWLERAEFPKEIGDKITHISPLVSAVDAASDDVSLIREVAFQLCKYIDEHKYEIPRTRRGAYLASVRGHMESVANVLDATGLSRLAWLFLLEDNRPKARQYALKGKENTNRHCLNILDRLEQQAGS
jgi:hypothetical protein